MTTVVPTLLIVTLVGAAAFLGLVAWATVRQHRALLPAGRAPARMRPLPTACDLGAQLMAASATQTGAGGAGGGASGAAGGRAPKRQVDGGPTRRDFLRYGWLTAFTVVLGGLGGGTIAMLWPDLAGGFGAELDVEDEATVLAEIESTRSPYIYRPGRFYLVAYDVALDPDGSYADVTNGASVMALYQKCPHLGCAVPWCLSAQWFQCPCHGSNYNRWGEYQLGPAPRGMDRFSLRVQDGRVLVDTSTVVTGPSRDANVLVQAREGPSCVS